MRRVLACLLLATLAGCGTQLCADGNWLVIVADPAQNPDYAAFGLTVDDGAVTSVVGQPQVLLWQRWLDEELNLRDTADTAGLVETGPPAGD
ncbi:MAG: hypothetical protein JXQ75_12290 [Phycisphaerae bacterium]|nr:hypothetical protein [Phycisphaerae bacterium]